VLTSPDDLSGKEIVLRKSSSYWANVERLNERFKTENKAPVKLHAAPEDLEDEDLLEMVNDGLISTIVVDDNLRSYGASCLPSCNSMKKSIVNANGEFGWAVRQSTPKLLAAINDFAKTQSARDNFRQYRHPEIYRVDGKVEASNVVVRLPGGWQLKIPQIPHEGFPQLFRHVAKSNKVEQRSQRSGRGKPAD
jgi:membrane-bound lytic murein transglycosylase MltF